MQAIATKDAALIKSFMTLDSIWDSFSDDMSDKREYHANIGTSHLWLKVFIDGEMGGMIFFRNETLTTLSLHPYLLPKYRKLSRELIKKRLECFYLRLILLIRLLYQYHHIGVLFTI